MRLTQFDIFPRSETLPETPLPLDMPSTTSSSVPKDPTRRPLDHEALTRKLKEKRTLFSKSRSLSLASFRLPAVSVPKILPRKPNDDRLEEKKDKDEEYLKRNPAAVGELDLLNLESLIDLNDVEKKEQKKVQY